MSEDSDFLIRQVRFAVALLACPTKHLMEVKLCKFVCPGFDSPRVCGHIEGLLLTT